jgi:hypothetical protein
MKLPRRSLAVALALLAAPLSAQDDGGGAEYIVVTASKRANAAPLAALADPRPIIGLRRQADSALRRIEITSDSLDSDVRRKEVEAMLLAALDRAKKDGITLVTGEFEVIEVTRANWPDLFPALAGKSDDADDEDDDEDEDEDDNGRAAVRFEDDGDTATLRLMAKTPLAGSITEAQRRIAQFARAVPANGRAQLHQRGTLSLTIVKPEQYRDEIYRRIAQGARHAAGFYGEDYGVELTGLDREIAWAQVSNTEVFLYIPYRFTVGK